MNTHHPVLLAICLTTSAGAANAASPATWTSNDGVTIQARFVGVGPRSVLIDKAGVVFSVPFDRLASESVAQARILGGFGVGSDGGKSKNSSPVLVETKPQKADARPSSPAVSEKMAVSPVPQASYARPDSYNVRRDTLGEASPPQAAMMALHGRVASATTEVPDAVQHAIAAGNVLQTKPYKWGGGRAPLEDTGYDCSGSVSYVLIKAGLLRSPKTSRSFATYGEPGPGKWITIFARPGHVYMTVCGLRLDTGGRGGIGESGPRWSLFARNTTGCSVRHPTGF